MNSRESIVKIVTQYFAPMTKVPFEFRGKIYEPKTLRVSPMIFKRRMGCPPMCGGCCAKLSVEYITHEVGPRHPEMQQKFITAEGGKPHFESRQVEINGVSMPIVSDLQKQNKDHFCHYLNQEDGRCTIHGRHPFSCDFELLRFSIMSRPDRANQLNHRPFGRGWAMLTVDGTRGAKCTWEDTDRISIDEQHDIVRKLERLKQWMEYWRLEHKVDRVIDWVASGPHKEPIYID
jgi:Fe-S-cluster containining protein